MSECTRCNYCSLQAYKREAEKIGKHIELGKSGGFIAVYRLPNGVALKDLNAGQRSAAWVSAMIEISDSCVCVDANRSVSTCLSLRLIPFTTLRSQEL